VIHEEGNKPQVPPPDGVVQQRAAVLPGQLQKPSPHAAVASRLGAGVAAQHETHDGESGVGGGGRDGSLQAGPAATRGLGCWVGASLQQRGDHGRVTGAAGEVQRGPAVGQSSVHPRLQ
jgi:hypothetical protein